MSFRRRLAVSAAALTLAGVGLVAVPATASATPAPDLGNCRSKNLTGSLGHKGKEIWCTGGTSYYYGAALCHKLDGSGYEYWHYGPVVGPGAKSTAWCDYGASAINFSVIPV